MPSAVFELPVQDQLTVVAVRPAHAPDHAAAAAPCVALELPVQSTAAAVPRARASARAEVAVLCAALELLVPDRSTAAAVLSGLSVPRGNLATAILPTRPAAARCRRECVPQYCRPAPQKPAEPQSHRRPTQLPLSRLPVFPGSRRLQF